VQLPDAVSVSTNFDSEGGMVNGTVGVAPYYGRRIGTMINGLIAQPNYHY
jgi:hypothetical protein